MYSRFESYLLPLKLLHVLDKAYFCKYLSPPISFFEGNISTFKAQSQQNASSLFL